jgi:hypothetical protein
MLQLTIEEARKVNQRILCRNIPEVLQASKRQTLKTLCYYAECCMGPKQRCNKQQV